MALTISGDAPNFSSASATTITGVTTLNGSSGVLATQNGMTGIAKAWVNFNGTGTPAIVGSFNVSSITDLGVGRYQINFTTVMPNTGYSMVVAVKPPGDTLASGGEYYNSSRTVSYIAVSCGNDVNYYDSPAVNVVILGS